MRPKVNNILIDNILPMDFPNDRHYKKYGFISNDIFSDKANISVKPKNVIRSEAMLFLMAAIRKVYWQDIEFQDIGNFGAQKLSQL